MPVSQPGGVEEDRPILYSTLKKQRTFDTEFPCRHKDGRDILCRMRAARIGDELKERRIVITYEDITEKKRAREELERSHRQLRELSAHLHSVREKESARIAREIHDELGQSLTALQMDVNWLGDQLAAQCPPWRRRRGGWQCSWMPPSKAFTASSPS